MPELIDYAERLQAAGLDLIPLKGKAPLEKEWRRRRYTSDELKAHIERGRNLGIRLPDDMLVVDVDPRNFDEGRDVLAEFEERIGVKLDLWPQTKTGSGGLHVFMKVPPGTHVRNELEEFRGIEFKAFGRQVVAPGSIHPGTGRAYKLQDPLDEIGDPDSAPSALLDLIARQKPSATASDDAVFEPEEISQILQLADPALFQRYEEEWLPMLMGVHALSGGHAMAEVIEWSERDPKFAEEAEFEVVKRWSGFDAKGNAGGRVGWGTFFGLLDRCPEAQERAWLVYRGDPAEDFDEIDLGDYRDFGAERPEIIQRPGSLNEIVAQAEEALVAYEKDAILQRGAELVRPAVLDSDQSEDGVARRKGSTVLLPVNEAWLTARLARVASWKSLRTKGDEVSKVPADPKAIYGRTLLAKVGEWGFPSITALVTAPTFDVATGRLIDRPGHDGPTGVLAVFDPADFPPIRENVGHQDAKAALKRVEHELLRSFPFVDEASRSVAVSAFLTALLRTMMRTAPMHCFDAPTAGTGKSKLADMAAVLATGIPAPAMSLGKTEEETEKRIVSALRRGDQVLLMDNVEPHQEVAGDCLASALTQERYQCRILGQSEVQTLSTRALFMATGNNLTIRGDMCRRVVKCRIDARTERPEEREFGFDPVSVAAEKRGELASDLLTAIKAYFEARRPCDPKHVGSFEDWTCIRGLLIWCGYADPALTMADLRQSDPAGAGARETLETWREVYGEKWVTARELHDAYLADGEGGGASAVWQLVVENLADGKADVPWLGRKLAAKRDTIAGGLVLVVDRSGRSARFRVLPIDE